MFFRNGLCEMNFWEMKFFEITFWEMQNPLIIAMGVMIIALGVMIISYGRVFYYIVICKDYCQFIKTWKVIIRAIHKDILTHSHI